MKNRVLICVLSVVMAISVVACGAASDNSAVNNENQQLDNNDKKEDGADKEDIKEENKEDNASEESVGESVYAEFEKAYAETTVASEIAEKIADSGVIDFAWVTANVEEGYLNGFNNAEIKGFKEGCMFGPAIGAIPFVGYIFTLEDGEDINAFVTLLTDNADLRWLVCNEADQMIVKVKDNTVFFLMCPESMEDDEEIEE